MQPNEIHQSIAQQVDHMRPDDLKPGVDVGMEIIDATTLAVVLPAHGRRVDIRYDRGPDTYTTTEMLREGNVWIAAEPRSDVYCDDLGEIVFGELGKRWTQPFGGVTVFDADGNVIEERLF